MRTLYLLPVLGALVGGMEFFSTMIRASSAPQQAAGAAMAVAYALLPYVFARAMVEFSERPAQQQAFQSPGLQPPPVALTPEQAEALKRRRTRQFMIVLLIAVGLFAAVAVSEWLTPPRQPGFYERNPGAP